MSNLNLENIVGFKAVDKDGNEQNVTVDEMVDMVSTRMVMALSETSTFAAAAATGNDVYENELPTVTDAANVRVLQSSGDAAQMTMQSLASKLGELMSDFGKFFIPLKNNKITSDSTEMKNISTQGIYQVQGNSVGIKDDGTLIVLDSFSGNVSGGTVKLFLGTNGNLFYYSSKNMDDWAKIYSSQI